MRLGIRIAKPTEFPYSTRGFEAWQDVGKWAHFSFVKRSPEAYTVEFLYNQVYYRLRYTESALYCQYQ